MIKILCIGKIKEKYLVDLIEDYKKRISKYQRIEIVELKDSDIYEKEINSLKEKINLKDYNIAMDFRGKSYNSLDFAKKIDKVFSINSNITFVIGGSNGLNDEIRGLCQEIMSFSNLTFPHGLFRGILLEQIYRAFKINNNESYHK